MRKVSYKTVLRDLYEDTDLQKMKIDEIYLARLIRKADKRIEGLYTVNTEKKLLTVEEGQIQFPNDLFNVDYVLLGDYSNEDTYFLNTKTDFIINIELTDYTDNIANYRLWSDISYTIESNKIDFVISNGRIYIDSKYNGQQVTLVYTSYPKNEKNEILLNDNHVDPIIAWVKHKVFERDMFKRKMSGKRLFSDDFAFTSKLESNKNKLIRNARIQDRELNEEYVTKNIVVNSYNAMLEHDSY
jgi:hypothetical protein